jgi:hypothetical protein
MISRLVMIGSSENCSQVRPCHRSAAFRDGVAISENAARPGRQRDLCESPAADRKGRSPLRTAEHRAGSNRSETPWSKHEEYLKADTGPTDAPQTEFSATVPPGRVVVRTAKGPVRPTEAFLNAGLTDAPVEEESNRTSLIMLWLGAGLLALGVGWFSVNLTTSARRRR